MYALLATGLPAHRKDAGRRVVGTKPAPGTVADNLQEHLDVEGIAAL